MSIADSNQAERELDDYVTVERDIVEQLADEFLTSYRAGANPTVDKFVDQFPALAETVAAAPLIRDGGSTPGARSTVR